MKTLFLALSLLLTPALAQAELITFGFGGSAYDIAVLNQVVFPFTGYYSFDSNAVGVLSSPDAFLPAATYPTHGLTLNYLDTTTFFNDVFITVRNQEPFPIHSPGQDRYLVRSIEFSPQAFVIFSLVGCHANPFTTTALPLTINFSQFLGCDDPDDAQQFALRTGGLIAEGRITSLFRIDSAYAVPEPAPWLLLGFGLVGVATFKRRG